MPVSFLPLLPDAERHAERNLDGFAHRGTQLHPQTGKIDAHRRTMIAAFVTSCLFLIS